MPPRKKEPPKPFYSIAHDYADSFEAFKNASSMLYHSVTTVLDLKASVKDPIAVKLLDLLQEGAENYRKATYGDL